MLTFVCLSSENLGYKNSLNVHQTIIIHTAYNCLWPMLYNLYNMCVFLGRTFFRKRICITKMYQQKLIGEIYNFSKIITNYCL